MINDLRDELVAFGAQWVAIIDPDDPRQQLVLDPNQALTLRASGLRLFEQLGAIQVVALLFNLMSGPMSLKSGSPNFTSPPALTPRAFLIIGPVQIIIME